jgi:hypothetical protein
MQIERKRRLGRFTVPADWADRYSSDLLRIMGRCAIVRAELLYVSDQIEYWARSDNFRELSPNEIVPQYVWHFKEGALSAIEQSFQGYTAAQC